MLTSAMFRNRSYDCQQLAERAPNARVRDTLLDMARTWTRLALEAEEWRRENSPGSREGYVRQSSSASRFTAGAAGFLNCARQTSVPIGIANRDAPVIVCLLLLLGVKGALLSFQFSD